MPNIKVGTSTFDLSSGVLEGILESIELMKKDGKEHGFLFCDTGGPITTGPKCTGTACQVLLKNCEGDAKTVGSFHTHPTIMSFSMGDYVSSIEKAKEHPENKYLLCLSLFDKGLRCKSLQSMPPEGKQFEWWKDTEENRQKVKPYFSPKVSINLDQIHSLLKGKAWEDLGTAETVIALDEGDVVVSKPPALTSQAEDLAAAKEALGQVSNFSKEDMADIQSKGNTMCAAIEKHISKSGEILPPALSHYLTKYCAGVAHD